MSDCILIETTAAVFNAIWAEHSEKLVPLCSNTDIDAGLIFTEWAFKDADYGLIQHSIRWDTTQGIDGPRKHRYWLVSAKKERE